MHLTLSVKVKCMTISNQMCQRNGRDYEEDQLKPLKPDLWHDVIVRRQILDICAEKGWLIKTEEIASLMGISSSAVTSKGDRFTFEIWSFERARRDGNYFVWSVTRSDDLNNCS